MTLVARLRLRGLRNLAAGELRLGDRITLLWGPNGAGKSNVLEALCLALAGHSWRTRSEREVIAFGEELARAEVDVTEGQEADHGAAEAHRFLWSLTRSGERRHLVDGTPAGADRCRLRPALAIFLPDRLALVKGPPAVRRAHLDRFWAALWPSRAETSRRYRRVLAQRNALLARVRAGVATGDSLDAWERELAAVGLELLAGRREAVDLLAPEFAAVAGELGLPGEVTLRYVPRTEATGVEQLAAELRSGRESDLARGYTTHGPHLDELALSIEGRSVRRYGSQGEQRMALLALLFAERHALLEAQRTPPLMLLDDVMSELDPHRRALLAQRLAEGDGQTVITATEPDELPSGCERTELALRHGEVVTAMASAAVREPPPLTTSAPLTA